MTESLTEPQLIESIPGCLYYIWEGISLKNDVLWVISLPLHQYWQLPCCYITQCISLSGEKGSRQTHLASTNGIHQGSLHQVWTSIATIMKHQTPWWIPNSDSFLTKPSVLPIPCLPRFITPSTQAAINKDLQRDEVNILQSVPAVRMGVTWPSVVWCGLDGFVIRHADWPV